jgi:hypothetical protein
VPTARSGDGRLALDLPAGRGRIDLTYRLDAWDRFGVVVTLATLGALAMWVLRRRASSC